MFISNTLYKPQVVEQIIMVSLQGCKMTSYVLIVSVKRYVKDNPKRNSQVCDMFTLISTWHSGANIG